MKAMRRTIGVVALAMLATVMTTIPAADRPLQEVGLEELAVQPAAAQSAHDVFWCGAVGSSGGIFGWGGALITTAAAGWICSLPGRGADATCATGMQWKYHRSVYGNFWRQIPQGKYYIYGHDTCAHGHWQYTGGMYGTSYWGQVGAFFW